MSYLDEKLAGEASAVVAIDVGGTGMKCAVIDAGGAIRHAERHPTGADRGSEAVVETILSVAEGLAGKARAEGLTPVAAAVVVPGVVDEVNGIAVYASNIGFREVPLRERLGARLGLPAVLGHDVRAGGLAEARLGAGRGYQEVLVVPIGTGIASAYVVGGRTFSGAHGAAGEIGHIVVRPGGPLCGCGGHGCLEAVASAAAVARTYGERTGVPATAAEVVARAVAGDEAATQVWRETVDALADGLLTGLTLFDPQLIVVGGGLAQAGSALLVPLREALRGKLTFQRMPDLVRAELGDEAGCLGAGLLALSLVESTS
ncbi:MAG: glucokinase [Micromonosporaceae bacterium]